MPITRDNSAAALERLELDVARRLLAAAALGAAEHMRRVSTSAGPYRRTRTRATAAGRKGSSYTAYANPSRPGEYPHLRTGHGRAGTAHEPTTPAAVRAAGLAVRVGVTKNAMHMAILELHRQRLGILRTFQDLRGQLRVVLSQKGA